MSLQDKGYEEWVGEMIGMREILHYFANISKSEVVGMRAPFLKPGRNTQYKVLEDFGYIYDSSVGVPPSNVPVWPYTLDYKISHECKSGTCPTKSFPGLLKSLFCFLLLTLLMENLYNRSLGNSFKRTLRRRLRGRSLSIFRSMCFTQSRCSRSLSVATRRLQPAL